MAVVQRSRAGLADSPYFVSDTQQPTSPNSIQDSYSLRQQRTKKPCHRPTDRDVDRQASEGEGHANIPIDIIPSQFALRLRTIAPTTHSPEHATTQPRTSACCWRSKPYTRVLQTERAPQNSAIGQRSVWTGKLPKVRATRISQLI